MRERKQKFIKYTVNKIDLINEIKSVELDVIEIKRLMNTLEMKVSRLNNMKETYYEKSLTNKKIKEENNERI